MREADIPSAARLLSTSFAPVGGYNWLQQRISCEETSSGLQERLGQTVLLVAEDDSIIVGTVEGFTPRFLAGKQVRFWDENLRLDGTYVTALAVEQTARRRGIAQQLMGRLENWTWSAGYGSVSLQVDATNLAALALYRRMGYQVIRADMRALTTPSRNALLTSVVFGGARERSLLALQKTQPLPQPDAEGHGHRPSERKRPLGRLRDALRKRRRAVFRWLGRVVGR